jgi:hypothetical protein
MATLLVTLLIKLQKLIICTIAWPYSSAEQKADPCTKAENISNAPYCQCNVSGSYFSLPSMLNSKS